MKRTVDYYVAALTDYAIKKGLVNNYVAFTSPRRCPTYFIVGEVSE